MIRTLRTVSLCVIALIAVVSAGDILWRSWTAHSAEQSAAATNPAPASPGPALAYVPQKVVYHLNEDGGFFGRSFKKLVQVANNHVDAVGAGRLDLRIVLQGDGVNLLTDARSNAELAGKIDSLKAKGVKFLVCGNTLRLRKIETSRLHGVSNADIVRAGVAEVSSLQQQGFVYVKPL